MLQAAICLALDDPVTAVRVVGALRSVGFRPIDCSASTCPMGASAVVTDRSFDSRCRRVGSCPGAPEPRPDGRAPAGCDVPLIRLGHWSEEGAHAFAVLAPECSDEILLITVMRAVRYGQHLAEMQAAGETSRD